MTTDPAETDGTTTNLEGRVSVLNQKVTPPGTARTDWMIAAELAQQGQMQHRLAARREPAGPELRRR